MENLDKETRDALKVDMVIDITTTGRNTGQPRRIEIWAHNLDGQVIITGSPGRRSWYANMVANPEFTFHLKRDIQADLQATAKPVSDEAERRSIFTSTNQMSQFDQRRAMNIEDWVKGSCLVEVSFS